jgi:hypothetical protein
MRVHQLVRILRAIERHARAMLDSESEHPRRILALAAEAREEARHLESEITRVGR